MQIYYLFPALGIHQWSYIVCHEHFPAQPLRHRAQLWPGLKHPWAALPVCPTTPEWGWETIPAANLLQDDGLDGFIPLERTTSYTDIWLLNTIHGTGLELLVKKKSPTTSNPKAH